MATATSLPGLNEDESARLRSQAELGLQFDDEMRNYVIRLINACPSRKTRKTKTS
jgi:hypothetical protein